MNARELPHQSVFCLVPLSLTKHKHLLLFFFVIKDKELLMRAYISSTDRYWLFRHIILLIQVKIERSDFSDFYASFWFQISISKNTNSVILYDLFCTTKKPKSFFRLIILIACTNFLNFLLYEWNLHFLVSIRSLSCSSIWAPKAS